jgi:catechol 2,3-dioxygenase-like lactoylglutathione lyase family enzyme
MSRVQLALNVSNLEASIEFYSKMFGTTPHKLRPGYANFSINEPPLKLVLIETPDDVRGNGAAGALNHLGVEVDSIDDVNAAAIRLTEQGMSTLEERGTDCCYAIQDKVWVHDPAGTPWEFYTVTDDNPTGTSTLTSLKLAETGGACCAPGQC